MSPSFTTGMIEGLRVSSTGIVAAETDRGVVFFDNGGRRALTVGVVSVLVVAVLVALANLALFVLRWVPAEPPG